MEKRIKSITEAYSTQPRTMTAYEEPAGSFVCAKIELISVAVGPNVILKYVGFNLNNEKLFEYMADSVNVHYFQ